VTVRSARLDEIGKFYELWEEFLEEHHPVGGVLVNERALDEGGRLFQTYVGGSQLGNCYFWVDENDVPQGFFLSGEPIGFFDMFDALENCAIVYGVYVRKSHRGPAGMELATEAAKRDLKRGIKTGCTVVKAGNEKGRSLVERTGATLVDMRYAFDLEAVAKMGDSNG
jgi:hypothetical protein